MKINNPSSKELRAKKPADLEKHLIELKKNLETLNHEIYTNKETKTHQIGVIKKAIARAKTIQTATKGEEK